MESTRTARQAGGPHATTDTPAEKCFMAGRAIPAGGTAKCFTWNISLL